MENNNWSFNSIQQPASTSAPIAKTFVASVFSWMGIALAISAITAYVFGTMPEYSEYLRNPETGGNTGLGTIVMLAPLAFILIISFGINRLSLTALTGMFLLYSVVMGMSLSFVFQFYLQSSVAGIFLVSALMFGIMGVLGYTTKTDLTKLGSILMMALIGIIIASLVNMFMHSSQMSYIISFISVIVFTGLTAYDVQKIKEIGASADMASENTGKMAIMGALTLYLDFVNLFLALLRLFGGRRD